jgi:hypothetical protein
MDNIIDIIVSALPWFAGAVDVVTVAISALPSFGELVGTAQVAISAIPWSGLPIWLYGVIGFLLLMFADKYIRGEL